MNQSKSCKRIDQAKKLFVFGISILSGVGVYASERGVQVKGSDGARIEEALEAIVDGCFGRFSKYSPSFFPDELRKGRYKALLSRPADPKRIIEGVRFELLARSVFDNASVLMSQANGSMGRSVPIDVVLPDAVPLNETSNLVYGFTCTTALKLALEQDFQFNGMLYSGGKVSSMFSQAFRVQADNERKSALALMYGTFRSPLSIALESSNQELRVQANSATWSFYRSEYGKKYIGKAPKYLKALKGWFISQSSSRALASIIGAQSTANAGIFGFSANVSGSAKVTFDSDFSRVDFTIILDEQLDDLQDMAQLPSPSVIRDEISSAAVPSPSEVIPYIPEKPFPVGLTIRGIPAWLCNSAWSARMKGQNTKTNASASLLNNSCVLNANIVVSDSTDNVSIVFRNEAYPLDLEVGSREYLDIEARFSLKKQAEPAPIVAGGSFVVLKPDESNPTYTVKTPFYILPLELVDKVYWVQKPSISCAGNGRLPQLYPSSAIEVYEGRYWSSMAVTFDDPSFESASCEITWPLVMSYKGVGVSKNAVIGPYIVNFKRSSVK